MALLALNLFFGSAGLTIMLLATYRYHTLIQYNRQATYQTQKANRRAEYRALALMYFFVAGFVVSLLTTLSGQNGSGYTFGLTIFFFGSIFIHSTISSQISMTMLLREKNMETMKTFVNAIDLKDSYTKGHSEHVYDLVALIYNYLPENVRQKINKPKLLDAAILHDCGKLSIKDDILNKCGRLSTGDWEAIKTHPANGKKMLDDTCFSDISEWVLYHHERVDGKGYYGLSGDEIPVESKIISIADTYSALSTDRIYRQRYSHERTIEIMALSTGSQLDIELMGCFMRIAPHELHNVCPQEAYIYPAGTGEHEAGETQSQLRPGSTYHLQ